MSIFKKIAVYRKVKKIIKKVEKKEIYGRDVFSLFNLFIKAGGLLDDNKDILSVGEEGKNSKKVIENLQGFFSRLLAKVQDSNLSWSELILSVKEQLKSSNLWDKNLFKKDE